MKNIKLIIEYDGARFCGWQRQANQASVQQFIEETIEKATGVKTTLYGAGRTDSGVHAMGQVANFRTESSIPPERFSLALNQLLPSEIHIHESSEVTETFHARFDATARTYLYRLSTQRSALERNRRWEFNGDIAFDKLNEIAKLFTGDIDCSALCVPGSLQEMNRCLIFESQWQTSGTEYHYTIRANRFLHSMVRSIVGFAVRFASAGPRGSGELTLQRVADILTAGEWTTDHVIAPPQGLYLVKVDYANQSSSRIINAG